MNLKNVIMQNNSSNWVSPKVASQALNISIDTLRRWESKQLIEVVRSSGNHRRYNVEKYLKEKASFLPRKPVIERKKIIYARVSTRNQHDNLNLQRQIDYLRKKCPYHELITDIGSGINFKRKGMQTILEYAIAGNLSEVVVAYRERLCRFGFELYEYIFLKCSNATIVVLNTDDQTPDSELSNDIIQIVTVFSAKINGRKRYKDPKPISNNDENKNISEEKSN